MSGSIDRRIRPLALVADDDQTMRLLMRETLERSGFDVEEAEDGARALFAFRRARPEVVLLDVMMPGIDGFHVCTALRKMPGGEHVPVAMVTSLDDVESIHHAYNVGATDFITKPINWNVFGHRVRYIWRTGQMERALRRTHLELEQKVLELNSLHTLYKAVVEGVPVGVALLDSSCRLLFSNSHFDAMVRTGDVQTTGKLLEEIVDTDLERELNLSATLDCALDGEAAFSPQRSIHTGGAGNPMVVDLKALPLFDAEHRIQHVLVVVEDMSQKIKLEQKIRRMDRLSALGELSTGIAHEIRNPLTAVSSNAQLLGESLQGNKLKDLVDIILIAANRMEKLMKEVLDFARPRQVYFSRCMLDTMLCQAFRFIAPQAKQKDIHLEVNWSKSVPALDLDETQIQQVLINVLLNALRATPPGGKISANIDLVNGVHRQEGQDGSFVELSISDSGEGIAPDHIGRIFDPFFTTHADGTGLGLAISHTILREHGIDVQVESRLGKGTTFVFKFPITSSGGPRHTSQ